MKNRNGQRAAWRLPLLSEFIGTAVLVLVGLSVVILMFGTGTPIAGLIPSEGLRRLITGLLFGTTGGTHCAFPKKAERTSTGSSRWHFA